MQDVLEWTESTDALAPGRRDRTGGGRGVRRGGAAALLAVVVTTFVLIALTLPWLEFSSGSENLNVGTALEIRRTDRWLLPTLDGEPRVAKPPLTAWITAAAIGDQTFGGMSSPHAAVRAAAQRQLAWQVRWPFLLAACVMLLATAELGRVLSGGDWRIGAVAAAACASSLFFLRHGRSATTDVQLALWVAVANVFLAHAVMRGRWWTGAIGAGVALGLAFMSKGPVAIAQSVAPLAAFVIVDFFWTARRARSEQPGSHGRHSVSLRTGQFATALIVFALVALPWYALVASNNPDVWARWQMEVTREGATDLPASRWYNYLSFFAFIAPWTAFLIAGIAVVVRDVLQAPPRTDRARGMLFALLMLIVPIVIMSFFRDRKERYLLPMIVPASVLIARAVIEHFDTRHLRNAADRIVVAIHWGTLLVMAIGLPIAGAVALKTVDGGRWYSPTVAIVGGAVCAAIVVAGILAHRRRSGAIVAATLLAMLALQVLFMHGYRHSREGRSEMKPLAALIWERTPAAEVFITGEKKIRSPVDLAIYLNRPVPWVDDPAQLRTTSGRPAVVVIRQRKREAPPAAPAGASKLGTTARDDNWWHAFLLKGFRSPSLSPGALRGEGGERDLGAS